MIELKDNNRNILKNGKIIGIALMGISLVFIIREIMKIDFRSVELENPWTALCMVLLFSCVQTLSVFLSGWGWKLILEFFHGTKLSNREVLKVYARANVGKYLPGNVMHYAGRNLLGSRLGWKHSDIIISSFLEVVLILMSACIISLLLSYNRFIGVVQSAWEQVKISGLLIPALFLAVILLGVGIWLFNKNIAVKEKLKLIWRPGFWLLFAKTFLAYALSFLIPGFLLVLIYRGVLQVEVTISSAVTITGASVLSWLAGFVTPGAPGGLGVKESILLLMLGPLYGKANAIIAALIHRLVSILGDVAAFLIVTLAMSGRSDAYLKKGERK